ncbi:MAG: hypothetical protein R3A46_21460 [Thermomicrobiales bacterium]
MVVARIWTFNVKPGRMAGFMEWIAENIREPKRLDDSDLSIRVFRRSVAGDGTGKIDAVAKYENTGAAGSAADRLHAEPDYQRIVAHGAAADAPALRISCRLLSEITPIV